MLRISTRQLIHKSCFHLLYEAASEHVAIFQTQQLIEWVSEWVNEWVRERERENFMINWKLYVKVYILFHFTICSARLTYTNVVTETTTTFYQRSLTISFVSQNKNNNQQHHLSSLISLNLNMKLKFLQVIWNVFFTTHYSLHFRKEVI
jgi:hypothetical protein